MWKDLFSIDEKRTSAIISGFAIMLVVYTLLIFVTVFTRFIVTQYVLDSISNILGSLIFGIVGGGGVQALKSYTDYRQNIKNVEATSTSTTEVGPL